MPHRSPAAPRPVVFDFDGVLGDNEPIWDAEIATYLRRRGAPTLSAEQRSRMRGLDAHACARLIRDWTGTLVDPDDFRDELETIVTKRWRDSPAPVPGAVALVERLAAGGHPLALASSSGRGLIEGALAALGIREHFRALVAIEDVARPKPDPEPYLRASASLGVAPDECLALEDSGPGAASARSAGLTVIGLDRRGDGGPGAVAHVLVTALEHLHEPSLWHSLFGPSAARR